MKDETPFWHDPDGVGFKPIYYRCVTIGATTYAMDVSQGKNRITS